jgi:hypothetical protein
MDTLLTRDEQPKFPGRYCSYFLFVAVFEPYMILHAYV